MKHCPYCDMEITELGVTTKQITHNGEKWECEKNPCPEVVCGECGSALDATDLGILGIPAEVIQEATK
jgi:hypothetical protein